MANKRYDQFSSGTAAGTDIILFGNPSTGELKKTAIEDLPIGGSGILASRSDWLGNAASGVRTDYLAYTIPANTITGQGQGIKVEYFWEWISTSTGLQVAVFWNASAILSWTPAQFANHKMTDTYLYKDSDEAYVDSLGFQANSIYTHQGNLLSGRDWTIDNTITIAIYGNTADKNMMKGCQFYPINI